jgi:DNA-directed RNA polymerase subunit RPC12/RpoP
VVIYAVCTSCAFLRVYSARAGDEGQLEACPACGSKLFARERLGRFPPTYVSRVSLNLLAEPELAAVADDEGTAPPLVPQ